MQLAEPAGGEPAANTLQPTGTSRHAMTADTKVRGTIDALPLVTRRWCLFPQQRPTARRQVEKLDRTAETDKPVAGRYLCGRRGKWVGRGGDCLGC